jgi:hypothetical protein
MIRQARVHGPLLPLPSSSTSSSPPPPSSSLSSPSPSEAARTPARGRSQARAGWATRARSPSSPPHASASVAHQHHHHHHHHGLVSPGSPDPVKPGGGTSSSLHSGHEVQSARSFVSPPDCRHYPRWSAWCIITRSVLHRYPRRTDVMRTRTCMCRPSAVTRQPAQGPTLMSRVKLALGSTFSSSATCPYNPPGRSSHAHDARTTTRVGTPRAGRTPTKTT